MKILVACEESQAVTIELRKLGHEAYSCDVIEQSGGHPEWHIRSNVLPLCNGRCTFTTMDGVTHTVDGRWDMIIAFVPCTKTSNAGARHLYKGGLLNIPRYYEGLCGKALFLAVWASDCDKVVIENPTPSKAFDYPEPTQVIQPYQFGHPFTKRTLLWMRGVPPACANEYCRAGENLVPERKLFRKAQRETSRDVYHGSSEKPKQNLPRHCKGYG